MSELNRRQFLEGALLTGTSLGVTTALAGCEDSTETPTGHFVDTNVHLCCCPFRKLKYGRTEDLVAKLRDHGIKRAWAGSYEALFHKNIDGVNARLAERCRQKGDGLLIPFGTVNPAWPDWEEDLRRCDEVYNMPGIKLYPAYHGYRLDDSSFRALVKRASERGLLLQIMVRIEDHRVHHPRMQLEYPEVSPLMRILPDLPDTPIILSNATGYLAGDRLQSIIDETNVLIDTAWLEGNGGLQRIMDGNHFWLGATVPKQRLVFSTHAPFFPVECGLLKFMESPLTEDEVASIGYRNAEQLLRAPES